MKSFTKFIIEANYMRFLKKNKNLTDDQRNDINDFFSKESPQAGSQFDWQNRKVRKMDFSDFESHMMKTPAGSRKLLKKIKIPGSKGDDYWPMRIKNKSFIANIPLNQETAEYMNSCKYGNLLVNYCIGWGDDASYWDDHVIDEQKVPVYVIDGRKKWVVMIKDGNNSYEVWDKMNDKDVSKGNPEPIPGFSIKKELLGSSQKKLYNEIREDFYGEENRHEEAEPDFSDAQDSYDEFTDAMEKAYTDLENAREDQESEMEEIRQKTLSKYEKIRDKWEPIYSELDETVTDIEEFLESDEETFEYKGVQYTKESIDIIYDKLKEQFEEAEEEYNTADNAYDEIDDMSVWDMYPNSDEYEWEGEVPDEDYQNEYEQNIDIPELSYYDDYAEYYENYIGGDSNSANIKQAVWEYVYEAGYGDSARSALEKAGLYRP
ncbi:MAG: hypothetical protein DRQ78_05915 [Epsilonproteobacteria bacterium]|nr:MAG: hypothetical protein DRQ78_05915 [Campylobacterota bacterium]